MDVVSGPSTGALAAARITPDGTLRLALASGKPLAGGAALTLADAKTNRGGMPAWLPPTAQDWQLHFPFVRR